MNNASLLYEGIESYKDIQELVGKHEDMFLDFKETRSNNGKMLEGDKSNFCKAASGFAHQEGGILVWGIEAREDKATGVDCAKNLKPVDNVEAFVSDLNKYIPYSTEPPVDGILHKVIYENDDKKANKGFAVSIFPKSNKVHRSLGPGRTRNGFYKRHGDSFSILSTYEIRALFFRNISPDLELIALHTATVGFAGLSIGGRGTPFCLRFALINVGSGIAKNCSVHIWLRGKRKHGWVPTHWGDEEGSFTFPLAKVLNSPYIDGKVDPEYTWADAKYIKFVPGIVICPKERLDIATVLCRYRGEADDTKVEFEYKIFSENMEIKEGEGVIEINFQNEQ